MNIGIQEHGFAGYFARSTEKRGENPRRRNGTVRCDVLSDWRSSAVTRVKPGKALRKERAKAHAPSQDIRFRLFLAAFPPERMQVHKNVCTKV